MIFIEFVISKFLHILNKISNADDLGLIFYGSIGLCSRMACSMVAWYYVVCVCFGAAFFWNVPSVRPMRLESPFRLQVRRSGWFLCSLSRSSRDYDSRESREMLLLPGSGCQVTKTSLKRENDAWELHRSYFILEGRPRFKPSLAPPLANIIFIGWHPKIRGLMTLPTMTNVSLKLWFVNRCCSCKKYQHLFGH